VNNSIFLTGSSGFVGRNVYNYLQEFDFKFFNRGEIITIKENIIINCAGKAHDLRKATSPNDYYKINTEFTKELFDAFLVSKANVFITLSSVKAIADEVDEELSEDDIPNPITHYGKSKLLAEQYILSQSIPDWKRVYILRPCMIYGPGNKGNLNLLYNLVSRDFPWPLGNFENKRSYLSIKNLCFIIKELIENDYIPSGVYNVADDIPLSTNEVIHLISESIGNKPKILRISKPLITVFARIGDFLKLPLNSERLQKLTESYVVSNAKIKKVIAKPLPVSSRDGLLKTFKTFNKNKYL
jgi:nucleoside-diphosphate-sugar epimerase